MIVKEKAQYTMKKDYMQLALIEWKKANPTLKRETDVDHEWVLNCAWKLRLVDAAVDRILMFRMHKSQTGRM